MVGRNESCTDVVDAAVICFADKGVDAFDRFIAGLLERPGEESFNPGGDIERVGENDRCFKRAEFVDLRNSRGLAKAVSDKYAGGHFFLKNIVAVRQDGRHACVHAACVVFQGNLADFHSRHIGHGIEFAGGQYADMDAVTADSVIGHLDSSSSRLMI